MSKISDELRRKAAKSAKFRCGYCQMPQAILPMPLEIEHILPQAAGGTDDEENLWLACRVCNSFKHAKTHGFDQETNQEVRLFNPRTQDWQEHIEFDSATGEIIGRTVCGRATVAALRMNEEQAVKARMLWVKAGWYPPKD
ncbi:MAG TPA: HNH endonuclease signature motif containing protein [Pyrinomonadaceae bacterium]|nr:HNH endonuclease signature motif containing protein [Pyrinomonadaceae bacterium]